MARTDPKYADDASVTLSSAPRARRHPSLGRSPRWAADVYLERQGRVLGSKVKPWVGPSALGTSMALTWGLAPGWDEAGPLALTAIRKSSRFCN